jgi:hypothetical protein
MGNGLCFVRVEFLGSTFMDCGYAPSLCAFSELYTNSGGREVSSAERIQLYEVNNLRLATGRSLSGS